VELEDKYLLVEAAFSSVYTGITRFTLIWEITWWFSLVLPENNPGKSPSSTSVHKLSVILLDTK
jgi:hypothetical protein